MSTKKSLLFKISTDIREFQKGMRQATTDLRRFGNQMKEMASGFNTYVTLPVALAGAGAVKMASDFEESMNKVNVAFGESAEKVRNWAKTSLQSFGAAEGSALDMAALYGDMATSMGFGTDAAATMAMQLSQLAGDLSSFKNIPIKQAMTALNGVFTGETESLKMLGVVMTETNLQEYALAEGIRKKVNEMTQAEKVALRYQYVISKTANAQGDFARTGGGAANQMRTFTEGLKQLGASFGAIILPAFTAIVTKLNQFISVINDLNPAIKTTIVVFAGLLAAVGPLLTTIGFLASNVIPALVTGFNLLKVALITNPIGATVMAAMALGAAGLYIYDNWEAVKEILSSWDNVKNALISVAKFIAKTLTVIWQPILKIFNIDLWAAIDKIDNYKADLSQPKHEFTSFGETMSKAMSVVGEHLKKSWGIVSEKSEDASNDLKTLNTNLEKVTKSANEAGAAFSKIATPSMSSKGTQSTQLATTGGQQLAERDTTVNVSYFQPIIDQAYELRQIFSGIVDLIGSGLSSAFESALTSGENFWKVLGKMLVDLVKKLVAAVAAAFTLSVIMSAFTGGATSALNFLGMSGGGFGGLFKGLFGKMAGIPGMATGGIVPPGFPNDSYPAMLSSREMVIPAPQSLDSIFGGGNLKVSGSLRASGKELIAVIDQAQIDRKRVRGY